MSLRGCSYLISLKIYLSICNLYILIWVAIWCSIFLLFLSILLIVLFLIMWPTYIDIWSESIILLILLSVDLLIIHIIYHHHFLLLVKFIALRKNRVVPARYSWMCFHIFIAIYILRDFILLYWLQFINFIKWWSSLLSHLSCMSKILLLIGIILLVLIMLIILFDIDIRRLKNISKFFNLFMVIRVLFK